MSDSPILFVRNVARRFGGTVALDDMNLVVERGSIHALVGESGAGKSTLTKVLAGIVRPDRGIIEFDGKTATIDSPNAAQRADLTARNGGTQPRAASPAWSRRRCPRPARRSRAR
jgi:ABC-type sugar transport system ATPase subunit